MTTSNIPKRANDVGKTILEQMGGRRLAGMLGVRKFIGIKDGLAFQWPNKTRSKGNYVEIVLTPKDLYNMTFFNLSRAGKKLVKKYTDLYAEDLNSTFEHQTGWKTRMAKVQTKDIGKVQDLVPKWDATLHAAVQAIMRLEGQDQKDTAKALYDLLKQQSTDDKQSAASLKRQYKLALQKQAKNPYSNRLDSDQERLFELVMMVAENEGTFYQRMDAKGAVQAAVHEVRKVKSRDLAHDLKVVEPLVVKHLTSQWLQRSKEGAQKQAKAVTASVGKHEMQEYFKHLDAAWKLANLWELDGQTPPALSKIFADGLYRFMDIARDKVKEATAVSQPSVIAGVRKGDILWGDSGATMQLPVFYEVLADTPYGKMVPIRKLESRLVSGDQFGQAGKKIPVLGHYMESPIRKKLQEYQGEPMVKIKSGTWVTPWDGKPKTYDSYN